MTGEIPAHNDELLVSAQQLLDYLSQQPEPLESHTATFAELLADRLGDEGRYPEGYPMATELLLYDCQTGVNGFTGEAMPHDVTGMPPVVYAGFRMLARQWGTQAFGEEAGSRIEEMYSQVLGAATES